MSVSESGVRPILAEAVDLARRALLELQPVGVGEHLGVTGEDECAATHRFAATLPGYRGWQWAVVVAAAPGAEYATVSESALLPGPDALVAPEFVPWDQRVRPGDLAPGDLLAPRLDDERLVPGYLQTGDPVADEVCEDIGLGRRQVLSREGRLEAAERWYSEFGPDTDMARSAPGTCGVCGFFVPLAGAMRAAFGVCANSMGADGRVVHVRYGCGAHSDTEMPTGAGSPLYEAYDDAAIELVPAAESTPRRGAANDDRAQGDSEPAGDQRAPESDTVPADSASATSGTSGHTSESDDDPDTAPSAGGNGDPAGSANVAAAGDVPPPSAANPDEPSHTPVVVTGPEGNVEGAADLGNAATESPGGISGLSTSGNAGEPIGDLETPGADSHAESVGEHTGTAAAGDAASMLAAGTVNADVPEGILPAEIDPVANVAQASANTVAAEEDSGVTGEPETSPRADADGGAPESDAPAASSGTGIVAPQADSGNAYSDAWAVSSVRVRPGESGAAER